MTLLTEHPSTVFAAQPKAFAPAPPEHRGLGRDEVRLLVASPDGITHTRFNTLADHLQPGDAVVINRSATVARAWDASSRGHGAVVLHAATRLSQAAAAIYVITNEDIRRSGATSIPEMLRLAPNLEVFQVNARVYSVTARGFGSASPNKPQKPTLT